MVSIRGATTIDNDAVDEILTNTNELLSNIIFANNLDKQLITAIFFSCTKDITAAYPAKAARDLGITQASLMCLQEMHVENSLQKCIRICIFYDKSIEQENINHIYLNNAINLRPDLVHSL